MFPVTLAHLMPSARRGSRRQRKKRKRQKAKGESSSAAATSSAHHRKPSSSRNNKRCGEQIIVKSSIRKGVAKQQETNKKKTDRRKISAGVLSGQLTNEREGGRGGHVRERYVKRYTTSHNSSKPRSIHWGTLRAEHSIHRFPQRLLTT